MKRKPRVTPRQIFQLRCKAQVSATNSATTTSAGGACKSQRMPLISASSVVEIETRHGPRTYDVQVSELRERRREIAGRLVVLRDVTDYLRASEAARVAAVAKAQFLANMSHEIRTPMNGVLGLAQHLAHLDLGAEQRGVVEDILSSGAALLQVIDDVLDFSKLEAGKLRIDPAPFEPRRLVADVTKLFAPRAREAGIRLDAAIADGVPDWLMGDGGRIRQVLVNLVSNGVKFTKQGGVEGRHHLRAVLGDALGLVLAPDHEAGDVLQEHQRHLALPGTA